MFLKTEILKALEYTKNNDLPLSYWMLASLRIILTLLPQYGYIHPDEYFQNIEVMAGDTLQLESYRTWEFNNTFPIRNILLPKLTVGAPYNFIKQLNPYFRYYFNWDLKTTYMLLVAPRLLLCLLSFVNDFCLYKMCSIYGQNYRNRLKIFASSYVILVFCTRTFSNSIEMALSSILLYLVSDCMLLSDRIIYHNEFLSDKYKNAKNIPEKVKLYKLKLSLPAHSLRKVFLIAALSVLGIFNRPTFLCFAMPPVFFWLLRGLGTKYITFKDFHYRIITLILCSSPFIVILIVIDSTYYGYLTLSEIQSLKLGMDNFVVTPLNFLKYNTLSENLSNHGLHPRWLHFLVNVPLLFSVLGFCGQYTVIKLFYRFSKGLYGKLPRVQSVTGLMFFSFITPVFILSLFPHQEARFIIPVLVPLVYLNGNFLHINEEDDKKNKKVKSVAIYIWYISNVILTVFFGFIHQGGIYPLLNNFQSEVRPTVPPRQIHLATSHIYSLPISLLHMDSNDKLWYDRDTGTHYKLLKNVFFHEFGSIPLSELVQRLELLIDKGEQHVKNSKQPYRIYLAIPCSLENNLYRTSLQKPNKLIYHEEYSLYPHLSTEAFPNFPERHDLLCQSSDVFFTKETLQSVHLNIFERTKCFFRRTCLKLYKVSLRKYDHH